MDTKKNSFEALLGIFTKLSIQQRLTIGIVVIVTIILLGFIVFVFNEPNYTALYTNLAQEDASRVVDYLTSQKILYKIEDNGQTIRVPKEKVYEVRLALAGKGIPSSGIVGYEIFDKSTMGMSDFMQKLNYKRALEGELARTILQQEDVEGARVHIVVPQKSVFKDEEKAPTASVVLKLRGSNGISKGTITAITNLISSSVEGLLPGKVTIIDTQGRLLSKEMDDNPLAAVSSRQYEIRQNVENYLAQKAQSILDNVLGYGNSIIQVNADLDFNQVEKTMESYDPDSQVAISEQTTQTENNGSNAGDSSAQSNQNTVTNYEISKTIERVVQGTGNVKRLSFAAVINGIPREQKNGEKTEIVYEQRSADQIKKLEDIIRNAIGIDVTRNDQFSIVCIPFETKVYEEEIKAEPSAFDIEKWSNLLLIFVAVGASMFILKGLLNRLKNEKIILGGGVSAGDSGAYFEMPHTETEIGSTHPVPYSPKKRKLRSIGDIEDEITEEASEKLIQQEKIQNYVTKNPADAAKLINAWLHEDEY